MKKLFFTFALTLAVMVSSATVPALTEFPAFSFEGNNVHRAPAAKQASPVELKEYKQATSDCAYFDWWYFGYSENSYFGYVLFNEQGKEIAFTVLSQSETDYVTYLDGVTFKDEYEDRDVESHYYISTYWILNSLNGVRWGGSDGNQEVVSQCVKEVVDGSNSIFALRTGTYYLYVYEVNYAYDESGNITGASLGGYDRVKFSLEGLEVSNLKATVSSDKKTAKISWTAPAEEDMPAGAYLHLAVTTGSKVVFDNESTIKKGIESPLTIDVEEGRSYRVLAQYVTSRMSPLGSDVQIRFDAGTNKYVPTNPKATVKDDEVKFTWSATKAAEYYGVNVYQNGFLYAQYTTTDQKLSKTIPTGTYTWEVAAFEKGSDDKVYPISDYIKGNSFSTKTAPLPEGTVEMNVWGVEAFYMKDYATTGRYPWLITFETGTSGGTGLPEVWIIVWSDREFGLSGKYSSAAGNIEISATAGEGSLINTNGTQAGLITANSVELKLEFDGFEMEYTQMGYYIPYYSGSFLMSCADGKTYHGTLNQLLCGTYDYDELTSSSRSILYSMYDEDGGEGVDDIQSTMLSTKRIENGQLIIEKNGVKYNVLGTRID